MAHIIEIHDFSDPALDVYARATENQLVNRADPANAPFIAESRWSWPRFDAGCIPVLFDGDAATPVGPEGADLSVCSRKRARTPLAA